MPALIFRTYTRTLCSVDYMRLQPGDASSCYVVFHLSVGPQYVPRRELRVILIRKHIETSIFRQSYGRISEDVMRRRNPTRPADLMRSEDYLNKMMPRIKPSFSGSLFARHHICHTVGYLSVTIKNVSGDACTGFQRHQRRLDELHAKPFCGATT